MQILFHWGSQSQSCVTTCLTTLYKQGKRDIKVFFNNNYTPVKLVLTPASSLETKATFILENNAPEQPDLNLESCLETNAAFIFKNNAPNFTLASSLETNSASIRKHYAPVKPVLTPVSSLETNEVFILENDAPEQIDLNLASRLETNTVFILKNNAPNLTLESSLKTLSFEIYPYLFLFSLSSPIHLLPSHESFHYLD